MRQSEFLQLLEKRETARIRFSAHSPSARFDLWDHHSGRHYAGRFINLGLGGFCAEIKTQLEPDHKIQVALFDEAAGRTISLNAWIKERIEPGCSGSWIQRFNGTIIRFLKRRARVWDYRCQFSPSLTLETTYRDYFERLMGDRHLTRLTRKNPIHVSILNGKAKAHETIRFKVAVSAQDKQTAYRLIYNEYFKRGYVCHQEKGMLTSLYQLLPTTKTYIGCWQDQVAMTLTAVIDSPVRLPMDGCFGDLLDALRKEGRHLVQFNALAILPDLFKRGSFEHRYRDKMSAVFSLYRLALRCTLRAHAVTDIVITVPPAYEKLYQYLCFERLGDARKDKEALKRSMVPMRFDVARFRDPAQSKRLKRMCLWKYFFSKPLPRKVTRRDRSILSLDDIRTLFVEQSDLLRQLPAERTAQIYRHFPTLKEKISTLS